MTEGADNMVLGLDNVSPTICRYVRDAFVDRVRQIHLRFTNRIIAVGRRDCPCILCGSSIPVPKAMALGRVNS